MGTKRPTINLDLTRHPTLLVKVDNGAVSLAPRTQIHSSSLSDVGLAGVGFRSANQNTDTGQQKGEKNVILGYKKSPTLHHKITVDLKSDICLKNMSYLADEISRNLDKGIEG